MISFGKEHEPDRSDESKNTDIQISPKPVFLLGHPRSGTNYLKNLLAIHPNIHSLTEPFSLHSSYFTEEDEHVLTEADYDENYLLKDFENDPWLLHFAKDIKTFLSHSGTEVTLVKETSFFLKLRWLRQYLGQIRIILLLRNPYKVISSFKKDDLYTKWSYDKKFERISKEIDTDLFEYKSLFEQVDRRCTAGKLMFLWLVRNMESIKYLDRFENIIVSYENLVSDTLSELNHIMEFVGLPRDAKQDLFIEETQKETLGSNIYSSFRNKNEQLSMAEKYLTSEELNEIERLLNGSKETMEHMGIDFSRYFLFPKPDEAGPQQGGSIRNTDKTPKQYSSERCFLSFRQVMNELTGNPIEFETYYFSRFPVTNTQFCSFLNAVQAKNEQGHTYMYINTFGERCRIRRVDNMYQTEKGFEDDPCTYVNWYGCKEFCNWLGIGLPQQEVIKRVFDKLLDENINMKEINIGETVGKILPVKDTDHSNALLNFVGNIWKWTDSTDEESTACEFGGAFNSSKHHWNTTNAKRHKRFGASNLGFHVTIPRDKIRKSEDEMIPDADISRIKELEEILSQDKFKDVRAIFFDLDGTLHDFNKAAGSAMNEVYAAIEKAYGIGKEDLQAPYRELIKQAEKSAFSDGKRSHEYRAERFTRLLEHFSIKNDELVDKLVQLYGDTFEKNVSLDSDTLETLRNLSNRYPLYLVTEGPIDAQERTVRILGVGDLFKKIFTSGEYGKIKETGELFEIAKNELKLNDDEIVIVGDSLKRDILGAIKAKIKSVLITP